MADRHEPQAGDAEDLPAESDRLDSWKAVAAYLGRTKTTLERWEAREGLPIHRLPHAKRGSVFAYKHELDTWRRARERAHATSEPGQRVPVRRWWNTRSMAIGTSAVLLILLFVLAAGEQTSVPRPSPGSVFLDARPIPLANDSEGQFNPSLSPDGRHVVFDRRLEGRRQLVIKTISSRAVRPLELSGDVRFLDTHHAAWSPRGDLIAFLVTDSPQMFGLHVVPAAGGLPLRLTTIAGIGLCWHPSGASIGFADREGPAQPFSIYSVSVSSGERLRLTTPKPSAFGDTHCAFSPDGRELAVERHDIRSASDLFVVNVDGRTPGVPRRFTSGLLGMDGIAWSPDGAAIVFGSPSGLWRIPARGADSPSPTLVTGAEGTVRAPSFSGIRSDGSVSLTYQYQLYDVNIWRWDRGTVNPQFTRLPGSTVWESFPALSPDGARVAYISNRTGHNELWVANGDGSDAVQITDRIGTVFSPQWSPDGRRVAFSSHAADNWDIHVIDADGANLHRYTTEPSQEETPTWSRDGAWIYFRSDRSGTARIWRMPASGGPAVVMTQGTASQAFESPDGRTLYFVRRDDAPGLWAKPLEGGSETLVVPEVGHDQWAVTDRGIAFLLRSPASPTIQLRPFGLGAASQLATLPPGGFLWGFSMTRDARAALWMRVDYSQNDIMLIDNWRR